MNVTLLRTLTWKSILGFGKYRDLKIQEIFDTNHTQYLRFIYYNILGITFINEILDAIYILHTDNPEDYDYRIEKPGINIEKFDKLNKEMFHLSIKHRENVPHAMRRAKTGARIQLKMSFEENKILFSRGNLQRMNQGHKYKH